MSRDKDAARILAAVKAVRAAEAVLREAQRAAFNASDALRRAEDARDSAEYQLKLAIKKQAVAA